MKKLKAILKRTRPNKWNKPRQDDAHLEANGLQLIVEPIQDTSSIKDKGWFQHFFMNAFVIQFLRRKSQRNNWSALRKARRTPEAARAPREPRLARPPHLKHVPLGANDDSVGAVACFIGVLGDGHEPGHCNSPQRAGGERLHVTPLTLGPRGELRVWHKWDGLVEIRVGVTGRRLESCPPVLSQKHLLVISGAFKKNILEKSWD